MTYAGIPGEAEVGSEGDGGKAPPCYYPSTDKTPAKHETPMTAFASSPQPAAQRDTFRPLHAEIHTTRVSNTA